MRDDTEVLCTLYRMLQTCTELLPVISAPNGMSTLRVIVTLRPPLRQAAMDLLLDMTTHPGKSRESRIYTQK
jgi:hypothetical protein